MSNKDNIDFSTLTWVKSELDETLNRAKEALMTYIEEPEDSNQLQFCITYLHQIQGTLKMVELYGAAMVAEEMEAVAKALLDDSIDDTDAAFDVLLRSILQLPDYLERIELGHKDVPIVLLPLVNDLRAVRSQRLLSESALFNPDLNLGVPEQIQNQDIALQGNQLTTALMKLRSAYQMALLKWIKHQHTEQAFDQLQQILSKLRMVLPQTDYKQLFWVYSGLLQGLADGRVKDSISIKSLAAKVDLFIRDIAQKDSHVRSNGRALTRNFLYYIALGEPGSDKVDDIKNYFNLDQFIPDETEIKHAQGSLSGKNKELLQTVSSAIKDDILVVQESLDLFIRNKSAKVDELSPLLGNLQKIADTLGILGLGVARDEVLTHQSELNQFITDNERPKDSVLLDVAQTLLRIESDLGDHIQSLGITTVGEDDQDHMIPRSEQREIVKQLAKESIVNLQQVKANFVAFIEAPWDKHQVEDNPMLLKQIAGALNILDLKRAGEHIQQIIGYVDYEILTKAAKPSASELEQLATVVSSIEYYLENLDQGNQIRENLLNEVSRQIELLQQQVSKDDRAVETIAETDRTEHEKEAQLTEESDAQEQTVEENAAGSPASGADKLKADALEMGAERVTFGEDADDFIKEVFIEEFEEELPHLQTQHQAWQQDPSQNEQNLTEVRRIFHTLKGSGRLVGAEVIGEFGWKLENMCNRALDGAIGYSDNFKTVLSSGIGLAEELLHALKARGPVPSSYPVVLQNADNVADGSEHLISLDDVTPTADITSEDDAVAEAFADESVAEETATEAEAVPDLDDAVEELDEITGSMDLEDMDDIGDIDDIDDIDKPIEYEPPTEELRQAASAANQDSSLFEDTDESTLQQDDKIELSWEGDDVSETEDDSFDFADEEDLEAELASLDDDFEAELDDTEPAMASESPEDQDSADEDDAVALDADGEEESVEDWEHDTAFIQILQKEVGAHLDDMAAQLNHYRDDSNEVVNDDFVRTVHTLNGAASMANVKAITDMTTPLEKLSLHLHDSNQQFNQQDIEKIEALIQHTKGQLASLGNGEMPNDDVISVYFKDRVAGLSDDVLETAAEDVLLEEALSDEAAADEFELETDDFEFAETELEEVELAEFETDEVETDEFETDEVETDEVETDEVETDEVETDEAKADEAETAEAEAGEVETDEAETDEVETDEVETAEVETDEVETDEVETDEVETDEVETAEVETDEVEADEVEADEVETDEAETDEV
ncbi:MAG: hypothetical protein DWP95_07790, partial [Proteobacteria bacterium]